MVPVFHPSTDSLHIQVHVTSATDSIIHSRPCHIKTSTKGVSPLTQELTPTEKCLPSRSFCTTNTHEILHLINQDCLPWKWKEIKKKTRNEWKIFFLFIIPVFCWIWGSHSGDYKEIILLGHNAVRSEEAEVNSTISRWSMWAKSFV
jgi:hypothetical protein